MRKFIVKIKKENETKHAFPWFQYANGAGWVCATAAAVGVLYGLYGIPNGYQFTPAGDAIYRGLHRTVWAMALGWVIFACVTGNGGEKDFVMHSTCRDLCYCVVSNEYIR